MLRRLLSSGRTLRRDVPCSLVLPSILYFCAISPNLLLPAPRSPTNAPHAPEKAERKVEQKKPQKGQTGQMKSKEPGQTWSLPSPRCAKEYSRTLRLQANPSWVYCSALAFSFFPFRPFLPAKCPSSSSPVRCPPRFHSFSRPYCFYDSQVSAFHRRHLLGGRSYLTR